MVRARNAMRLAADALAPSIFNRPLKLTIAARHALSFLGSACVLTGVMMSLLLCVVGQSNTATAIEQAQVASCSGLPEGRPCQRRGEHALFAQIAFKSPADSRRALA